MDDPNLAPARENFTCAHGMGTMREAYLGGFKVVMEGEGLG